MRNSADRDPDPRTTEISRCRRHAYTPCTGAPEPWSWGSYTNEVRLAPGNWPFLPTWQVIRHLRDNRVHPGFRRKLDYRRRPDSAYDERSWSMRMLGGQGRSSSRMFIGHAHRE